MIDDVVELVVEQPRIERVEDAAHADHAEPGDEMAVVVHRQRRHAVAWLYAKPLQRLAPAAAPHVAISFQLVRICRAVGARGRRSRGFHARVRHGPSAA